MMKRLVPLLLFTVGLFCKSFAQNTPVQAADTSLKEIQHSSDKFRNELRDSVTRVTILVGHVVIVQGTTTFYCDSAIMNPNTKIIEAFGNIHINDNDSVHTYAQYLIYHTDTRIANLQKQVKLTNGKTVLYTEELQYNVNDKIGEYHTGGRIVNEQSVLTSKEGIYYTELKDAYFYGNVVLKDPKYNMKTDSLLYNTGTQVSTFLTLTHIVDSANKQITTRDGFYDIKNRQAYFGKNPVIKDGAVTIRAMTIESDDSTGISILTGNAVYKDTAQGVVVMGNHIKTNKKEGYFIATQHPLMIIKQDQDSLYISADTLISGRLSKLPKPKLPQDSATIAAAGDSSLKATDSLKNTLAVARDSAIKAPPSIVSADTLKTAVVVNAADAPAADNDSTDRFFSAHYNVRIFSDSLQAISDSLFYSGKDSIFKLFKNPILWASNSQVTGDTIYLYTKNKKADRLYVFENGMAINKTDSNATMFNQLKGNRLYGYFTDGTIDYMRAKGSAESVYFVKDEHDKLVGINKATADIIDLRFKNKELDKVVFISEPKATMYPSHMLPEDERKLRNFKWQDTKRPKTKFELFGN
ncbi:MAG: OstA-like protein [Chitinophagaceae bacterium]